MATHEMLEVLSFEASGDLSAHQFKYVVIDSNGQVALAGNGAAAIGVLQNKPSAIGQAAEVAVLSGGRYKVKAAAALATIGTELASDAAGLATPAVATDRVLGIQLSTTGAANELVEVLALSLQVV
jgi:hypothetical protein